MKVSDEMVGKAAKRLMQKFGLSVGETADYVCEALEAALADVPEPDTYFVPVARWHEATARIAELEAQLLEKLQHNIDLENRVDELEAKLQMVRNVLDEYWPAVPSRVFDAIFNALRLEGS